MQEPTSQRRAFKPPESSICCFPEGLRLSNRPLMALPTRFPCRVFQGKTERASIWCHFLGPFPLLRIFSLSRGFCGCFCCCCVCGDFPFPRDFVVSRSQSFPSPEASPCLSHSFIIWYNICFLCLIFLLFRPRCGEFRSLRCCRYP